MSKDGRTLHEKRVAAGRHGGLETARRHPGRHSEWGRLGGRRKLPTIDDLRNSEAGHIRIPRSGSFRDLLREYRAGL